MSFVNDLTGWVVGAQGFIARTLDGGVTWSQQDSGTNRGIPDFFFLDASRGWIAARHPGTIATTADSGQTGLFKQVEHQAA